MCGIGYIKGGEALRGPVSDVESVSAQYKKSIAGGWPHPVGQGISRHGPYQLFWGVLREGQFGDEIIGYCTVKALLIEGVNAQVFGDQFRAGSQGELTVDKGGEACQESSRHEGVTHAFEGTTLGGGQYLRGEAAFSSGFGCGFNPVSTNKKGAEGGAAPGEDPAPG